MPPAQPLDLAVRLADEGTPIKVIARAVRIPSGDLRTYLQEAQADGRLLSLPPADWPTGYPRDTRALQLSRLVVDHKDAVDQALTQLFELTVTESRLLLTLLQNGSLAKDRADMSGNAVDVHVHHIRKRLQPFGIGISTLWAWGYQISVPDQRRAVNLILEHVAATLRAE